MKPLTLGAIKSKNLTPLFRSLIADAIECYDDFVAIINNHIAQSIRSMVRARQNFQDLKEDQLTQFMVSQFESFGFRVSHDKQIGGHVDITVEYEDYLWLAEAKIHSSYLTLQRGWYQLTTRYMTGMPGESEGSFFIYNFNKDAASVTQAWRAFLTDFHPDVTQGDIEDGLNFATQLKHEGSGLPIKVNHYNIPLLFEPKDRGD